MTRYKHTNVTAKIGVNFIRTVVEAAGSLFHKIEQENDLGVDALVELVRDERGSWYAGELARHVDEYGTINPYA